MNKFLSSLLFLSTMLVACKKEHSYVPSNLRNNTLYKVTFNIGLFSQQATGLNTNNRRSNNLNTNAIDPSLAANPQITNLIYSVYDSQGNGVHVIKQKSTEANFGSYTDNLAAGTYTIVFAGGGYSFTILSTANDKVSRLNDDAILYNPAYTGEIFFKKITLTVVNGVNGNQEIALTRLTSKIQVTIKDALPSGTGSVGADGVSAYLSYMVGAEVGGKSTKKITISQPVSSADIGTKNFSYTSIDFLPTPAAFQIRLFAMDKSNLKTAEKFVNAIAVANTVTMLSGNLFGGSGGGNGFVPKIDTSWNATPILKQF